MGHKQHDVNQVHSSGRHWTFAVGWGGGLPAYFQYSAMLLGDHARRFPCRAWQQPSNVSAMQTEIWVALIAVVGVLTQVLLTYLVSRQSANDLRTNIDRQIEIVRKLNPGSSAAIKLEQHIDVSLDELITRDTRRWAISRVAWSSAPGPALGLALWGIYVWNKHGIPEDLRYPVVGLSGFLLGLLGGVVVVTIVQIARVVWLTVRYGYLRLTKWRLQRRFNKLREKNRVMRAYRKELTEWRREAMAQMTAHKDELIAEHGQQWWDDMTAEYEELEKKGSALDRMDDELIADEIADDGSK